MLIGSAETAPLIGSAKAATLIGSAEVLREMRQPTGRRMRGLEFVIHNQPPAEPLCTWIQVG